MKPRRSIVSIFAAVLFLSASVGYQQFIYPKKPGLQQLPYETNLAEIVLPEEEYYQCEFLPEYPSDCIMIV